MLIKLQNIQNKTQSYFVEENLIILTCSSKNSKLNLNCQISFNLLMKMLSLIFKTNLSNYYRRHNDKQVNITFQKIMRVTKFSLSQNNYKNSKDQRNTRFLLKFSLQNIQNKKVKYFLRFKHNRRRKIRNQNFNLFEKLIYLYSREEIYPTFNQYIIIKKLKTLSHLFQQEFKENQKKTIRISFDEQDIFEQIIRDFNLSKDEGKALFWNINKINQFIIELLAPLDLKKLHKIFLYEIKLDEMFLIQVLSYDNIIPIMKMKKQQYYSHSLNLSQTKYDSLKFKTSKSIVNIKLAKNNYTFCT
ncbi:unnamed protein product [Paramecium pentaurelia]|uniref:Uncharacterized protein n=1 Tax=Paramecium pentaurelia TaxID=43138 RepID=A0A8S1XBZ0_9CILI|nr:unnamed protein product [Paramecium pentaurelia]